MAKHKANNPEKLKRLGELLAVQGVLALRKARARSKLDIAKLRTRVNSYIEYAIGPESELYREKHGQWSLLNQEIGINALELLAIIDRLEEAELKVKWSKG